MRVKQLESYLDQVEDFECPKIILEQYSTPSHIAARMVHIAAMDGHIIKKKVLDLGCGTGMLSIAAALMEADWVIGAEIDENALNTARENIAQVQYCCESIDLVNCNVLNHPFSSKKCDVVLLNPPFGTKGNKGIDISFLQTAISIASEAVYSLHKSSTRKFILKKGSEFGAKAEVLGQFEYDLPKTYTRHTHLNKTIEVDLFRFLL